MEIGDLVTCFADTIIPDSKLMSDSAVLCFCQFIACFLSHMPVKFAIHVNLSNSRKPTRSLKPIYQNTCSMPTSEVARGRQKHQLIGRVTKSDSINNSIHKNEIISRSNHMNLTLLRALIQWIQNVLVNVLLQKSMEFNIFYACSKRFFAVLKRRKSYINFISNCWVGEK